MQPPTITPVAPASTGRCELYYRPQDKLSTQMVNLLSSMKPLETRFEGNCVSEKAYDINGVSNFPAIYDGTNVYELRDAFLWVQKEARKLARSKAISKELLDQVVNEVDEIVESLETDVSVTTKGSVAGAKPGFKANAADAKTHRIQSLVVNQPVRITSNTTRTFSGSTRTTSGTTKTTSASTRTASGKTTSGKTTSGTSKIGPMVKSVTKEVATVSNAEEFLDDSLFQLSLVPQESKRLLAARMGITESQLAERMERGRVSAASRPVLAQQAGKHSVRQWSERPATERAAPKIDKDFTFESDHHRMVEQAQSEMLYDDQGNPIVLHQTRERKPRPVRKLEETEFDGYGAEQDVLSLQKELEAEGVVEPVKSKERMAKLQEMRANRGKAGTASDLSRIQKRVQQPDSDEEEDTKAIASKAQVYAGRFLGSGIAGAGVSAGSARSTAEQEEKLRKRYAELEREMTALKELHAKGRMSAEDEELRQQEEAHVPQAQHHMGGTRSINVNTVRERDTRGLPLPAARGRLQQRQTYDSDDDNMVDAPTPIAEVKPPTNPAPKRLRDLDMRR